MRSLTAHVQDLDNHGRLPFHPGCPTCQQTRVAGTLATAMLPPRAPALLAAGVIAASSAGPAVSAMAAEPDQERSGSSTVAPSAAPDPVGDPDFDPGGEVVKLPTLPAPSTPQVAQPQAPPAAEPDAETVQADGADPVVDTGDGSDRTDPAPPASSAVPAPAETPEPTQPAVVPANPAPAATPEPVATSAPDVQPAQPPAEPRAVEPRGSADSAPATSKAKPRITHRDTSTSRAAPISAPTVPVAAASAAAAVVASPSGPPANPGDDAHTVQPGESLWAIASDLLGGKASPARIAREVNRLWQLNSERIGTGDPDLLMTGTRLKLR